MRILLSALWIVGLVVGGCGGSSSSAKAPGEDSDESADEKSKREQSEGDEAQEEGEAEGSELGTVPTKCASDGEICAPSMKYIKRMCEDSYPTLAVAMFSGGTPWTRGYISVRKVEAVNAFGGMSGGEDLVFDEEVIVLFKTASDPGGMQVSGAGSIQVFRWNGTCSTLADGELRMQRPGRPKSAKVQWRYLESGAKEALRKDQRITDAYRAHRKECKGVTMGQVSDKCEKYDKKLTETIVQVAREGSIELPIPEKLPQAE